MAQCQLLSSYGIPETIGYHDFHDKNVLIEPYTQKMTLVDWGEAAIIHPFFITYLSGTIDQAPWNKRRRTDLPEASGCMFGKLAGRSTKTATAGGIYFSQTDTADLVRFGLLPVYVKCRSPSL